MSTPEELARQKIEALVTQHGCTAATRSIRISTFLLSPFHFQHAIQRLYAILRAFFFLLNEWMPQGQLTRGDRPRVSRVQRSVWNTPASPLSTTSSAPIVRLAAQLDHLRFVWR